MYVSPINNKILLFDCRKSEQSRKQNLSFQKTQVLLEQKNPVKKINRYMNIAIIAMLPILCYQIQNQVNEITKEYIQFEPLIKDFDTQEGAINYSIERITEHLNEDEPREYSIHINDKKHRIISEVLGNDSTVLHFAPGKQLFNRLTTFDYSYTSLHGHPVRSNGATSTFSFQDFKTFVSNENCLSTYVVNKDGKYCRLEKTDKYKEIPREELEKLEYEFNEADYYSWESRKIIYNKKGEQILNLVDYPGMHDFMDRIAKRYGMKYVTTYGTYGIYGDIYSKGYHEGFEEKIEVVDN